MFDKLFQLFKNDKHTAFISVQQTIYNLVKHFESEYVQEGSRDAAIDAVIEVLQSYKNPLTTTPATGATNG